MELSTVVDAHDEYTRFGVDTAGQGEVDTDHHATNAEDDEYTREHQQEVDDPRSADWMNCQQMPKELPVDQLDFVLHMPGTCEEPRHYEHH